MKKQVKKITWRPQLTPTQITIIIILISIERSTFAEKFSNISQKWIDENGRSHHDNFHHARPVSQVLQRTEDERDYTIGCVTTLLENRVTTSKNELSEKEAIIDYLTAQLVFDNENNSHADNHAIYLQDKKINPHWRQLLNTVRIVV